VAPRQEKETESIMGRRCQRVFALECVCVCVCVSVFVFLVVFSVFVAKMRRVHVEDGEQDLVLRRPRGFAGVLLRFSSCLLLFVYCCSVLVVLFSCLFVCLFVCLFYLLVCLLLFTVGWLRWIRCRWLVGWSVGWLVGWLCMLRVVGFEPQIKRG